MEIRRSLLEAKGPGHVYDYFLPSSVEVKDGWDICPLHNTSSKRGAIHCLIFTDIEVLTFSRQSAKNSGEAVNLTCRPAALSSPPPPPEDQDDSWYLFLLEAELPQGHIAAGSIKVATNVTASLTSCMINLFVQGRTKSLRHHTVQVRSNMRQFVLGICRAQTTVRSLWLLLSLCARENRERRNMTCVVKTAYGKENLLPH
jgi:hypothetical protein